MLAQDQRDDRCGVLHPWGHQPVPQAQGSSYEPYVVRLF